MEPFKSYHIGGQKKKKNGPMLCSSLNVVTGFNKWRSKKYDKLTETGAGKGKLFYHLYLRVTLPVLPVLDRRN